MLIWCRCWIIVIIIIIICIWFVSQNIGNGKTFNSFKSGTLSWWWYGAFTRISYPFETFQRAKIIVSISSTIIFRWMLNFWWWWAWCSNRNFRTSWTGWRWWICCTQHRSLFRVISSLGLHYTMGFCFWLLIEFVLLERTQSFWPGSIFFL